MRDEDAGGIKMVPEERRSKRIASPYPVGDISFSGEQERALSRFPIRFSHFAALTRPSRERTITFFLFSFNYRCQGVVRSLSPPFPSPAPLSSPRPAPRPPRGWPPTFSPRSTCLYYSFIYSNYLHDVNLSLPLISLPSRALSTATPLLVDELLAPRLLKARAGATGARQDVWREFSG